MTTYLGFDVLDQIEPDRGADGNNWGWLRPVDAISNPLGREIQRPRFEGGRQAYQFDWHCYSRAEKAALREWFDDRGGSRVPFWIPTYRRDMVLYEQVSQNAEAFRIEPARYALQVFNQGRQRHHVAFYDAGTIPSLFRRVTAASLGAAWEDLAVDTPFPAVVPTSIRISYLLLVRLASDELNIVHSGPEYGRATLSVIELPAEVPA